MKLAITEIKLRRKMAGLSIAWLLACVSSIAQPFTVQGPGVNTNDFRTTIFVSGLDFPLGMVSLSDGSLLVGISQGANFDSSTGKLVRFTDTNQNGVADGPAQTLYTGLPGSQTALRAAGSLFFVTGNAKPISILRAGATPADPLTLLGQVLITYPAGWTMHRNSALAVRKTPGQSNSYDLLFQVGAQSNFAATSITATMSNINIPGALGALQGDSIHMLTIIDHGSSLSATNPTRIASGVRNPAGFACQSATGDLYFQDNGIDGLVDGNEPLSADELNLIVRTNIGGAVEYFGFPTNYTTYRTGVLAGGAGIQPLIAFQPQPNPSNGHESEGVNDITFAPPGFPAGLNTGIFLGFHGKFSSAGTNNEENPVVYANPSNGTYFHFIEGQLPGVGHLDGVYATRDSLFIADLVSTGNIGNGAGAGVIYQIKSLVNPLPPVLSAQRIGSQLRLTWDLGTLQEADTLSGQWNEVVDAFSPHLIQPSASRKYYRAGY